MSKDNIVANGQNDGRLNVFWIEDKPDDIIPHELERRYRKWLSLAVAQRPDEVKSILDGNGALSRDGSGYSALPADVYWTDFRLADSKSDRVQTLVEQGLYAPSAGLIVGVLTALRYTDQVQVLVPYSGFKSEFGDVWRLFRYLTPDDIHVVWEEALGGKQIDAKTLLHLTAKEYRSALTASLVEGRVHIPVEHQLYWKEKTKEEGTVSAEDILYLSTNRGIRRLKVGSLFMDHPGIWEEEDALPIEETIGPWFREIPAIDPDESEARMLADLYWSLRHHPVSIKRYAKVRAYHKVAEVDPPDWDAPQPTFSDLYGWRNSREDIRKIRLATLFLYLRQHNSFIRSATGKALSEEEYKLLTEARNRVKETQIFDSSYVASELASAFNKNREDIEDLLGQIENLGSLDYITRFQEFTPQGASGKRSHPAAREEAPASVLKRFANSENAEERRIVAANPSAPEASLRKLAGDKDRRVRKAVAENPAARDRRSRMAAFLQFLRRAGADAELQQVGQAPEDLTKEERAHLLEMGPYGRRLVAAHPGTSKGVLRRLATDADDRVRRHVSGREEIGGYLELLRRAGADAELQQVGQTPEDLTEEERGRIVKAGPFGQLLIAAHPQSPDTLLIRFSKSAQDTLREAAAMNPSAPVSALRRLATDKNDSVRKIAADHHRIRTFLDLLRRAGADAELQQVGQAPEDLTKEERAHLLEMGPYGRRLVAAHPGTSKGVLRRLATDADNRVRRVVFSRSDLAESLLREASESDSMLVIQAVARNPSTPSDVLRRLADQEDQEIQSAVIANPSSPPELVSALRERQSEKVMDLELKRARHVEELVHLVNPLPKKWNTPLSLNKSQSLGKRYSRSLKLEEHGIEYKFDMRALIEKDDASFLTPIEVDICRRYMKELQSEVSLWPQWLRP